MGVDYSAKAVIGCRISGSDTKTTKQVRGCKHSIPTKKVKFCPECGKPAWEEEDVILPFFREAVHDDYKDQPKLATDFGFFQSTDNEHFVVGYGLIVSDRDGGIDSMTVPDLEGTKQECKEVLEPLGLWDESQFGLWVICYCSY